MIKAPLPTGPQYFINYNRMYQGEPVKFGVYNVNIMYTPNTKYPCIGI